NDFVLFCFFFQAEDGIRDRNVTGVQTCALPIFSIPTRAWAQKIYPEKTADEAVSALWDTIYKMVRVDGEDPIEVWNKHNQRLENAFITLNDKQYTKLHLKAPGTDLEVGLPKG